jgi:hypothetical protein
MLNRLKSLESRTGLEGVKVIEVYIEFNKIGEIDTINEKYSDELTIEAKWVHDQHIVSYDAKKHWNPQLTIENAVQIGKDEVSYTLDESASNFTLVTETRRIKGVFWERLELQNFPIDIQELSVTVISKLTMNDVKIISDSKRVSFINLEAKHTFFEQQKWRLYKMVKISGIASYDIGSSSSINELPMLMASKTDKSLQIPKIVATCFCHRRPGYYLFNAYFLIFLITVSSLTIFSIDCKLPQNRLQTTYTILLTR